MATTYSEVLMQLSNFYGDALGDKWSQLYLYGPNGVSNEEYETILRQAGVQYTKYINKKTGAVRYGDYNIVTPVKYAGDVQLSETFGGIGNVANSNTVTPTVEGSSSLQLPAAVETVTDATGKSSVRVNAGKNATATATNGSKVIGALGKVNAAITGAAIGTALGNLITKGLYKVNPDFWGGVNPSTINFKDYFPPIIGDFYNMYFGVNENGNGQLYAQEDDFAAIALMLQQLGAFTATNIEAILEDKSPLWAYKPGTYRPALPYYWHTQPFIKVAEDTKLGISTYVQYSTNSEKFFYGYDWLLTDSGFFSSIYAFSDKPFNAKKIRRYANGGEDVWNFKSTLRTVTHNGITYNIYYCRANGDIQSGYAADKVIYLDGEEKFFYFGNNDDELFNAWYVYENGTKDITTAIDGINFQPNAIIPDLSGIDINADDAIAQTLAKLKELYPSLFDNAITQKVTQPDGTEKDVVWLPVPTPDNAENPTTGESTQAQPDVKPDNKPAQDTILDIVAPKPPAPDTGKGDTPPVIIPTSAANALWSIYNPTLAQVKQFGGWLWSDNFIDQLKKMFQEPAQAIIGLHKVYGTPITGDESTIVVGYLDSGVPSKTVTKQYITIDCGAVSLPEFFGNVLDYTATDVSIFLPFVGVRQLSTADVMRSTISVKYHIDVLTGTGLAEISVRRDAAGGVLYQFSCDCAERFPISSGSYMGIVGGLVGVGAGIATAATGNLLAGGLMAANAIGNSHFDVSRTGNFSGNAGAMGGKVPYLIISRAQPATANNFPAYVGKPVNHTTTIGACRGFIKCVVDHLENIPATADELTEIDTLLQQGILA